MFFSIDFPEITLDLLNNFAFILYHVHFRFYSKKGKKERIMNIISISVDDIAGLNK